MQVTEDIATKNPVKGYSFHFRQFAVANFCLTMVDIVPSESLLDINAAQFPLISL